MGYLTILVFALAAWPLGLGAQGGETPIPPSQLQANQAVRQGEKLEPPMVKSRRAVNKSELQREAGELSRLAALVQKQIELVNQGELPSDLPKNLKRMADLVHKLRLALSQ